MERMTDGSGIVKASNIIDRREWNHQSLKYNTDGGGIVKAYHIMDRREWNHQSLKYKRDGVESSKPLI
jgi:hypothetical protein